MLSTSLVAQTVERDDSGVVVRASAIVRAMHVPSGQFSDGDGYCSSDESRFARAGGRAKLENDLRATATTRAKNRAIADLVGMGAVSAEEAEVSLSAGPQMRSSDAVLQALHDLSTMADASTYEASQAAVEILDWVTQGTATCPLRSAGRS